MPVVTGRGSPRLPYSSPLRSSGTSSNWQDQGSGKGRENFRSIKAVSAL